MTIKTTYKPGEVGLFRIPEEIYRPAPAVNISALKNIDEDLDGCPRLYQHALTAPREATPAMEFGSLYHLRMLEPEKFKVGVSHWEKPEGMKFTTTEGKAWKATHANLPIIDSADMIDMDAMCAELSADPIWNFYRPNGQPEVSFFTWLVHITPDFIGQYGTEFSTSSCELMSEALGSFVGKGKMDLWGKDPQGNVLIDLKTTDNAGPVKFYWKAKDLCYWAQCAWYCDCFEALTGEPTRWLFLAQSKEAPFLTCSYYASDEDLSKGRKLYLKWLIRLWECTSKDRWPGYYGMKGQAQPLMHPSKRAEWSM